MEITLSYKIQRIVSIEDIPDGKFTVEEIEERIDRVLEENAPDDFDILDGDFEYFGDCKEPLPLNCDLLPPEGCWVEVDGIEWATNGWCFVTRECPPINEWNYSQPWYTAERLGNGAKEYFASNKSPEKNNFHKGFFHKRFLPLKNQLFVVLGEGMESPGYCYLDNRLVAIIMPTRTNGKDRDDYFHF